MHAKLSAVALLVGSVLCLVGCGSAGPCDGDAAGHWAGATQADQIDLSPSCAFKCTGVTGCVSAGTYAALLGTQGTVQVSIQSSTGGSCLPAGTYACAYGVSASTLSFNCGAGAATYRR